MVIIREPITLTELAAMARELYGDLVKVVVDTERGVMAVGGELHSDEEALLLEDGSRPQNLWGINLYPGAGPDTWLEHDSLINIRPAHGNRTRGIDDPANREAIAGVVGRLVKR